VKDRKTKAPATVGTKAILKKCQERGLVMMSCGSPHNVFRCISTLVITEEELTKGFDILEYAQREVDATI
jgi:4-aminobutyrate aminotransferase/(S)-3-amino-2-methylpropionate transaminase